MGQYEGGGRLMKWECTCPHCEKIFYVLLTETFYQEIDVMKDLEVKHE